MQREWGKRNVYRLLVRKPERKAISKTKTKMSG
jgi:hypothetical protein